MGLKTEEDVKKMEETYRLYFENVSDVIFSVDRGLRVVNVSPSVEKVLGYKSEEIIGRLFTDMRLLSPAYQKTAISNINSMLAAQRPQSQVYEFLAKDGKKKLVEISGAPLVRDGEVIELVFIGRNVTNRLLAEQELRKAHDELESRVRERTADLAKVNEALQAKIIEHKQAKLELFAAKQNAESANVSKSRFLANMSHELRTPLNSIIGFTEIILDKKFGDLNKTQEEFLGDVLGSSHHLLALINDILDLSKVEAGKLELNMSEFNLKDLLRNSMVMVREKAVKHSIQVSMEMHESPDTINADKRQLKQIVYNLLCNAVKFTPDGGKVSLKARLVDKDPLTTDTNQDTTPYKEGKIDVCELSEEKKFLHISVQDTGIGIEAENLERIFLPFEQIDNSTSRMYEGTGLGLSFTKSLVELHGGRIWAESKGEGKGSKFHFVIPLNCEVEPAGS